MPSYSDQGFSEVESSVSLFYNYPVIQTLKLYYDWYYLDRWIYIILRLSINVTKCEFKQIDTYQSIAKVAKLSSGSGPRESRNSIFKELEWLSIQNRKHLQRYIMVFKCRNGLAPEYLSEHFSSNDRVHMYNTLNASQLRATSNRTAHYHLSFTVSASNLWNDLPSNIRKLSPMSSFKNALYAHIIAKPQFCIYFFKCFHILYFKCLYLYILYISIYQITWGWMMCQWCSVNGSAIENSMYY